MKLNISVQREGQYYDIGAIETLPGVGGIFSYDQSWLDDPAAKPLSLSLPLQKEPFPERKIRPYFEGLLPEADARKSVAREVGVSSNSYLKLISALGFECIGALLIVDSDNEELSSELHPKYKEFSQKDFDDLSRLGYGKAGEIIADTRLSLAGGQSKVGLYHDPESDSWWLPMGTAPSNYIAKPYSNRFPSLIENELFCLSLARVCGIKTVNARKANAEYPLLLIERYDRVRSDLANDIGGHPFYARLHQEDFAQALGIIPAKKYEEHASSKYLAKMADLLRRYSENAAADLYSLFELQLFNYLIGNCDAHCKNFSIIRDASWQMLRLAPAYDLVSTTLYPELSRVMGMYIGSERKIDYITKDHFLELAREINIAPKLANRCIEEICEKITDESILSACENETSETIYQGVIVRVNQLCAKGESRSLD